LKYRFKGRQRFYTIGLHGAPWTPDTGRREARRLLGLAESGRDPAAERDSGKLDPTFAEFASRYIEECAKGRKKARTVIEDQRNLARTILPTLGHLKLSEIGSRDVARLHASLRDRPIKANRCRALLSHMMTTAERWGLRREHSNPCGAIEPYPERARERMLTAEELRRLGEALRELETTMLAAGGAKATGRTDWRAIACVRLLLLTGARLSEILTLQWQYIDADRGVARLPDSKTGAKTIHLPRAALEVLASLPRLAENAYVLPGKRPKGHFIGIQKAWEKIRGKADLKDVRLHDLRHAYASVAVSGGDSLYLVGKILGHRQSRTTERYTHLAPDPVRMVAERVSNNISKLLSDDPK
jgi:integrase